jgi:tRNA pseudouridine55 synthase
MKSGLLLIDKPKGMTSHDVVSSVRRLASQKQVGHAGTLDPLATGLMVVLLGEATKLSDFILNGDKSYIVEALLGVRSDTGDTDGTVLETNLVSVTEAQVLQAVAELQGEFVWPVPIYSAVKVQGQKLYEKARAKEDFTPPCKAMTFYKTEFLGINKDRVQVRLHCSKGSFVRTWVEKLGEKLGCGATVSVLRRESSFPYNLHSAVSLSDDSLLENDRPHWIPFDQTLPDWPIVKVDGLDEKLLKNGQISHKLARFLEIEYMDPRFPGVKVISRKTQDLLAILTKNEQGYSIRRVFLPESAPRKS